MGTEISKPLQPAQRGTAVACALIISGFAYFFPESVDDRSQHVLKFVHLASCSTWLGVQFWVSFVAGLTKVKLLPRHMFGLVQSHLFPKYYTYGTGLVSVCFSTYLIKHPFKDWSGSTSVQGWALALNLGASILSLLVIEPAVSREVTILHNFERENGHGQEVGPITDKKLLENETYKEMRRKFFLWHGIAASVNLLSFTASGIYFWFLSKQMEM